MFSANLTNDATMDPVSNFITSGFNSPMSQYFGPVALPSKTDPYTKQNRTKQTLQDSQYGMSQYVGNTIMDIVFTSQTWATDQFLPYKKTKNINFSWTKYENNAHLLGEQPEYTAGRLVTQRKYTRSASLRRVGLSYEFEREFGMSAEGRVRFLAAMRQISNAFSATAQYDAIMALLHGSDRDSIWLRQNRPKDREAFLEFCERDVDRFGIAQKQDRGLEKLNTEINEDLESIGGFANGFIMPAKLSNYVEYRPEKVEYSRAGPEGPRRVFNSHPLDSPFPVRFVSEVPVFLDRNKKVEGMKKAEPLARTRQTGTYNTLFEKCTNFENYFSDSRERRVYDEDIDDWAVITLMDCVNNCQLFQDTEEGKLKPMKHISRIADKSKGIDFDFLTYKATDKTDLSGKTTGYHSVQYFGDIKAAYLKPKDVINAARGMAGAIRRSLGDKKYRELVNLVNSYPGKDDLAGDGLELGKQLRNSVNSALGPDNLFSKIKAEKLLIVLLDIGGVGVVSKNTHVYKDGTTGHGVKYEEDIEKLKSQALAVFDAPAPTSKIDEIKNIVKNGSKLPFMTVAEKIRNTYYGYVKDPKVKTSKKFTFKEKEHVDKWYNDRVNMYNSKLDTIKAKYENMDSGEESEPVVTGYMRPGMDLSGSGYKYLHSASGRKRKVSGLEHLSLFRTAADAKLSSEAPQQRRKVVRGSQTRSFSSISSVAYGNNTDGDFNDQLVEDLKNRDGGRDNNIGILLKNLKKISANDFEYFLAGCIAGTPVTKPNIEAMVNHHVPLLMNFVIARPHQSRHTLSIIKAARGGSVGNTFFMNPDMTLDHDGVTKYGQASFTVRLRSVVMHPENVYVAHDVLSDKYMGGNGSTFYTPENYKKYKHDRVKHSMFCFAVPITEKRVGDMQSGVLDLAGSFGVDYGNKFTETDQPHYSSFERYNQLYNFDKKLKKGSSLPSHTRTKHHLNRLCYPTTQFEKNVLDGTFINETTNRGHFGEVVGPGSAAVRCGKKSKYATNTVFKRTY